jgi:hypothetical protein
MRTALTDGDRLGRVLGVRPIIFLTLAISLTFAWMSFLVLLVRRLLRSSLR